MNFIKIGKLVNTHGIKGEVKILSDFTKKELVFVPGFIIYLGNKKTPFKITGYRHHKIFDMVTFAGINDINDVLEYKGLEVFINREDLELNNDYLLEDLVGLSVVENQRTLGKVKEIMYNNGNNLLSITGEFNFYIPLKGDFIKKVNLENKVIEVENTEGLIIWR